jgi:SAM-dependent methyltransferase
MSEMIHGDAAAEDLFYRAFEEEFRGSRELIKSRLCFYLPFIEPLKQTQPCPKAVDLGCGRGEWLEILAENGFSALGVDRDDGMLAACRERGLASEKEDAIECLKRLPDASLAIVSGFHIAEHLPFADLRRLVQESARVLKPGGLLILETPNPENLRVAGTSFYLDPTHERPLPPDLLKFLAQYYGFARVKIARLQEPAELRAKASITLMDVLSGSSPDYAVIAKKASVPAFLATDDAAFGVEYGLSIESLAARYDRQLADLEARLAQRLEVLDARQREMVQCTAWLRRLERILRRLHAGTLGRFTLKPDSRPQRVARRLVNSLAPLIGRREHRDSPPIGPEDQKATGDVPNPCI